MQLLDELITAAVQLAGVVHPQCVEHADCALQPLTEVNAVAWGKLQPLTDEYKAHLLALDHAEIQQWLRGELPPDSVVTPERCP